MQRRRRSGLTIGAGGAWLALVVLVVAHRTRAPVPYGAVAAVAVVLLGLALAAAGRNATYAWRGPELRPFPHDEAVCCDPGHAAVVRAAAQLRGTLGGAGHVHRGRLALSALGWLAAAGSAVAVLIDPSHASAPFLGGAVLVLCGAAAMFPARPFYYREAVGGRLVIHPRQAWQKLMELRPPLPGVPPIVSASLNPEPADGWGTSLIAPPSGGKDAELRPDSRS